MVCKSSGARKNPLHPFESLPFEQLQIRKSAIQLDFNKRGYSGICGCAHSAIVSRFGTGRLTELILIHDGTHRSSPYGPLLHGTLTLVWLSFPQKFSEHRSAFAGTLREELSGFQCV
jgi:hypothetical protein